MRIKNCNGFIAGQNFGGAQNNGQSVSVRAGCNRLHEAGEFRANIR